MALEGGTELARQLLQDSDSNGSSSGPFTDVEWIDIGYQVLWTAVAQVGIILLAYPVRAWYMSAWADRIRTWVVKWLGTPSAPPQDQVLLNILYSTQLVASLVTVCLWIQKTYLQEVQTWIVIVEYVCCFTVIVHYSLNVLKHEVSTEYINGVDGVFDVVTVTPLLYQARHKCWLSLSFLRAWRVTMAYIRLESTGVLDGRLDEVSRGYIVAVVKFLSFLFTLAAVTFLLEILGELPHTSDEFVSTAMGDLSIYQMIYWMMTTVSTVGYGDFSPTTMPSRFFVTLVIPAGVVFFTIITGDLLEIRQTAMSGRGSFHPKKRQRYHIVVCGGAVCSDSLVTIEAFLAEMLHPSRGKERPYVVLLTPEAPSHALQELVEKAEHKGHVKVLRGHPNSRADIQRSRMAKADMVFVLGDIFSASPDVEDERNSIISAVLVKMQPMLKIRLMLLRPENRQLAVHLGVSVMNCFAINEIKAMFIAQSCVSPGFSTMVLNMFKKDIVGLDPLYQHFEDPQERTTKNQEKPTWLQEFLHGASYEMYGCLLHKRFWGQKFSQVAVKVYEECGACLLAVQNGAQLDICPMDFVIGEKSVVFAVAQDQHRVVAFARDDVPATEWKREFRRVRDKHLAYINRHSAVQRLGPKVTASEMGLSREQHGAEAEAPREQTPVRESSLMSMPFASRVSKAEKLRPYRNQLDLEKFARRKYERSQEQTYAHKANGLGVSKEKPNLTTHEEVLSVKNPDSRDLLEYITTVGDHVVLIVQDESLWQQVVAVLHLMRSDELLVIKPVVVLSHPDNQPPSALVEAYELVVYLQGDVHKLSTLAKAGCQVAKTVVLMGGRPSGHAKLDMDREVLITASLVEKMQADIDYPGMIIMDLHSISNVDQLQYDVPRSWASVAEMAKGTKRSFMKWWNREQTVLQKRGHKASQHGPSSPMLPVEKAHVELPSIGRWTGGLLMSPRAENESDWSTWMEPGVNEGVSPDAAIHLHPRFASGGVMSRADMVRFFAFAYYTPGCLEVVEALADPERRSQKLRPTLVEAPFMYCNMTVETVWKDLFKQGILLLGVYRYLAPKDDNSIPYVYAFPDKSTKIDPNDRLFIMASPSMVRELVADKLELNRAAMKIHSTWRIFLHRKRGGQTNMAAHVANKAFIKTDLARISGSPASTPMTVKPPRPPHPEDKNKDDTSPTFSFNDAKEPRLEKKKNQQLSPLPGHPDVTPDPIQMRVEDKIVSTPSGAVPDHFAALGAPSGAVSDSLLSSFDPALTPMPNVIPEGGPGDSRANSVSPESARQMQENIRGSTATPSAVTLADLPRDGNPGTIVYNNGS